MYFPYFLWISGQNKHKISDILVWFYRFYYDFYSPIISTSSIYSLLTKKNLIFFRDIQVLYCSIMSSFWQTINQKHQEKYFSLWFIFHGYFFFKENFFFLNKLENHHIGTFFVKRNLVFCLTSLFCLLKRLDILRNLDFYSFHHPILHDLRWLLARLLASCFLKTFSAIFHFVFFFLKAMY